MLKQNLNYDKEQIIIALRAITAYLEGCDLTSENVVEEVDKPVEMLTIKECADSISGLSEHTIRQLVIQEKIPSIRTGQGKNGKILISKSALLKYIGGDV